jgi:hypothetical protein
MKRTIIWVVATGVLLVAANELTIAITDRSGRTFNERSSPVTEDQVRSILVSDGWTNVQVTRRGRFLQAMAAKDGRTDAFFIDPKTGRLHTGIVDDD